MFGLKFYWLFALAMLTPSVFCHAVKRSSDDDTTLCSYTFNVPANSGDTCPPGPNADSLAQLQTSITAQFSDLEETLNSILARLATNQSPMEDRSGEAGATAAGVAVNYKRWGRTTCPDNTGATIVYEGVMGKSYYTHGGGVNYLCLPLDPEFSEDAEGGHQNGAYIYGVEYEDWNSRRFFYPMADQDVPCAVCEVQGRSQVLMIPGKPSCPNGWTLEYEGLLASQHYTNKGSDFVCVSSDPEASHSGHENDNGGTLHVVEAQCGSLPCPPYVSGYELTCAVCTK